MSFIQLALTNKNSSYMQLRSQKQKWTIKTERNNTFCTGQQPCSLMKTHGKYSKSFYAKITVLADTADFLFLS